MFGLREIAAPASHPSRVLLIAGILVWLILWGSALAQSDPLAEKSKQARQAMSAGRFQEAVQLYRELIQAVPGNPGLIMNLGLALYRAGEYREAIHHFYRVLAVQPDNTSAELLLAVSHLKLDQPEQALEPLERVIQKDPQDRIALLELGDACLSLEQFDKAVNYFEKLAEIDPGSPKAWQGMGLSFSGLSARYFHKLEKLAPDSSYYYFLVARARARQQRYRSAFYYYREALDKTPKLRGIHTALAEIYRETEHPEWAREEKEKEDRIPPPDCAAESFECDFINGRYRELLMRAEKAETPQAYFWAARAGEELALQSFLELSRMPASAEIHELMAQAYRIQGLDHLSIQEWHRALKLSPEDPRLERELARSYWLNRDYEEALALLRKVRGKESESAQLNYYLGDTLLQLQKVEESVGYLLKAVKHAPDLLAAHASLGLACMHLERWREAVPHLERALSIDRQGTLHFQLARAHEKLGRKAAAEEMMEKFREISQAAQAAQLEQNENYQITAP